MRAATCAQFQHPSCMLLIDQTARHWQGAYLFLWENDLS